MSIDRRAIYVVCLGLLLVPVSVAAQESRAAEIAAEQAQKAAQLHPYEPSSAERWAVALRREFLDEPSGFYPYFASVYSGGGFTLGAGYRQFYGDRTHWDIKGLYSLKSYKFIELSTDSWGHAQGRLDLHARAGWRDATQVAYYGLGIDSPDMRSNFRMKQAYFGGDLQVRPGAFTVFGAGINYEDYTLEEGQGNFPSIEDAFTPATAPGLGVSPTYLHTTASGGIDWRPSPGYARHGGLYQVTYHNYADEDNAYSFDRVDGEIVQHIPILRENWVISLHGLVQTTLDDNDAVPYFLLPSLGSGSTLRAYPSWRFRDRHSLLLTGEFRWIPNRYGVDMALFYDMGKVTPRWDDLSLKGLKSNVGIGIRFHTPLATPLRIELAHGREGLHLVFAGSAAF
jgi:surface antigen Omp85-like protein